MLTARHWRRSFAVQGARPGEATDIAAQVSAGDLRALHIEQGLIHRDVKPSNVLVYGASGRAKISDFGLARGDETPASLTQEGLLAGTPTYMSPGSKRGSSSSTTARTSIAWASPSMRQ